MRPIASRVPEPVLNKPTAYVAWACENKADMRLLNPTSFHQLLTGSLTTTEKDKKVRAQHHRYWQPLDLSETEAERLLPRAALPEWLLFEQVKVRTSPGQRK